MKKLTCFVKFVVCFLVADGDSANNRMRAYVMREVCNHNQDAKKGKILLLDLVCGAHIITRIIIHVFGYDQIIPRCFAISFLFRFGPRYNRCLQALLHIVEYDLLNGGYVSGARDDTGHTGHNASMFSLILLRPLRTRARAGVSDGVDEKFLREAYCNFSCLLNGDIRKRPCQHFCRGCCKDARECARKIVFSLDTCCLQQLGSDCPSTGRWHTFEPAMVRQTFILSVHDLGERVALDALHNGEDADDDDKGDQAVDDDLQAEDDFHVLISKKVRKGREAWTDPEHKASMLIALWATEPVDHLSAVLQSKEAASESALLDLVSEQGLLCSAEAELTSRMRSGFSCAFPLKLLVHHISGDSRIDPNRFTKQARSKAMSLLAQLWSRFVVKYGGFPWILLRLADPKTSAAEKAFLLVDLGGCDSLPLVRFRRTTVRQP